MTPEDFPEAMKNAEFREHWSKLVAYHPTEWKEKSESAKWSRLNQLLEGSPAILKLEKERIDKLVFGMTQLFKKRVLVMELFGIFIRSQ
ncbi:hypothetical protein LJU32_03965 [Pseudomonas sp. B21_DOA]|nr:hypothetical protein LJU32_03965 [Pseudomonas sp. B21_DOA]